MLIAEMSIIKNAENNHLKFKNHVYTDSFKPMTQTKCFTNSTNFTHSIH